MTDNEFYIFQTEQLKNLPKWIVKKAVEGFRKEFSALQQEEIHQAWLENPLGWWTDYHFTWGMGVRNFLRDTVALDRELPSNNWDDYYIGIVEIAIGARDEATYERVVY